MEMTGMELGKQIAKGMIWALSDCALWVLILALLFLIIRNVLNLGVDDTDKGAWNRSGMTVKVDHFTGIQYLSDGKGGLAVRVDKEGKPLTIK